MLEDREHFGTCDCDRPECDLARALRRVAAEKVSAEINAEYGSTTVYVDFHLASYPSREWVCRAFPWRSSRACPGCGYVPANVPNTITFGTVFGLQGKTWRVISIGSTNRFSPNRLHSEDYAVCQLVSAEPWKFPEVPAPVFDVERALQGLFKMPTFRSFELANAMVSISG